MTIKTPTILLAIAIAGLVTLVRASDAMAGPAADHTTPQLWQSVGFDEPLVPTRRPRAEDTNAAKEAIDQFRARKNADDVSALYTFVQQHPGSAWAAAIWTNIGLYDRHYGYFSRALFAFQQGWGAGRTASDPGAKALADRAVGELARLYTSLGQFDRLAVLFEQIGQRPIIGSATEMIQIAGEELALVTKDPRDLFNCGPVGLRRLILATNPDDRSGDFIPIHRVGPKGTNLTELMELASRVKFAASLVQRKPGQAVPVPSLVHWKVGHFSAIVEERGGRYRINDPALSGTDIWVTKGALDTEASGNFLIPAKLAKKSAWSIKKPESGREVWGKGPSIGPLLGDAGDKKAHGGKNNCPMCAYDIKEAAVGITLSDLPVGYTPPLGPSATVRITYNQREDSQPANFSFFNVSQKWTMNWLSYVTDDPANIGGNVSRYLPEGGAYYYSGYSQSNGRFAAQTDDGSILVLASQTSVMYRRQLSDGTVEVYSHSDGSTSFPRRVFLSQIIDPQGNAITLTYDSQLRLMALTDAVGRQTTFTYGLAVLPNAITQITDPFGRSAKLTYDAAGRLSSITDILGLKSSFTYDTNSLVNSMTTPYGITSFSYTAPGAGGPPRFVEVIDPLGFHEREEWLEPAPIPDSDPTNTIPQGMPVPLTNQWLSYRESFYWNKDAYVAANCTPTGGCDYSKARATHFLHIGDTGIKSTTVESIKYPLENRIWYNYPGQGSSIRTGTYSLPIATARVLDNGSTQITRTSYDSGGYYKVTQAIDAVGRTTNYSYPNQIDLATITQVDASGSPSTLAQFIYNGQHRPIYVADASTRTTAYTYNSVGQLTSIANPLNQTTSFHYDLAANLASVTNANNVTAATYTYDAFDRVATFTDSEGWMVSYTYDAANRVTKIAYPDGTAELNTYDKLDLASHQDRIGRRWVYGYDANRRLTSVTDPAGKMTQYAYNGEGQVIIQTDPNTHVTRWAYDVEGRLITKTYADNSTLTTAYETTTSRVKSTTDALGQIKAFGYAIDNRLASIIYQNAVNATPNVSYTYDPYFPRIASMTDSSGTTTYSYVALGLVGALKLSQEVTPLTTLAFGYDPLGRMNSRTVGTAGAETFQYDAIGRLSGHASDLGSFTLAYLGQTGQIASRQLASSSLATTWSYLPNSGDRRLSGVSSVGLSAANYTTFQYTSNAVGQTTGVTQTSDVTVSYPPSSFNQTGSYNNLNQLTSLSSQALTYDANGNLLSDGSRTYQWDAENRLIGITYPAVPGKATAFAYDGLGRRVSISSTPSGGSAAVTSYVWCGTRPCQARSGSSVAKSYYAEGEYVTGSPNQSNYYGPDQTGSIRRVFRSSSSPAYDFDPYGNPLQATAPATDFGYAGMFNNTDSGLYLTTYRAFDPVSGRFLSRDPIGEIGDPMGNLYAYAAGNPINLVDPAGLFCLPQFTNNPIIPLLLLLGAALAPPLDVALALGAAADVAATAAAVDTAATAATAVAATAAAAEVAEGPLALPSPAPGAQASWSGPITAGSVPEGGMSAFRVWGDGSAMEGPWLSPTAPASSSAARDMLSLPPTNSAVNITPVTIPGGTQIQYGAAAPVEAWGTGGGGTQIQVLSRGPLSYGPTTQLPK